MADPAELSSSAFSSSSSSRTSPTGASVPRIERQRRHRRHQTGSKSGALPEAVPDPQSQTPHAPQFQHYLAVSSNSPFQRRSSTFYLTQNLSNTSIESSALLDHRDQQYMKPRRGSTFAGSSRPQVRLGEGVSGAGGSTTQHDKPDSETTNKAFARYRPKSRRTSQADVQYESGVSDDENPDDRPRQLRVSPSHFTSELDERSTLLFPPQQAERPSAQESAGNLNIPASQMLRNYGSVNFPPSVPTSPRLDPHTPLLFLDGTHINGDRGDRDREREVLAGGETIIDIDHASPQQLILHSTPPAPPLSIQPTLGAEEDVCFPIDECITSGEGPLLPDRLGRRTTRQWPDLSVLEEWSREEKEQRSEGIRAKKTAEPVYVGGRLRPVRTWKREEEDTPYRFTYFNDELTATIHAHTISELLQPGQTFKDLFKPEPRRQEEELSGDENIPLLSINHNNNNQNNANSNINNHSGNNGTTPPHPYETMESNRPSFWLDVLSPTDAEMKTLAKAFRIHPLTVEDILMQEAREKVELFRSYYLVCYKSFEQDVNNANYLDPVHMYMVVFREGILTFHFSQTPHPANVRRRIRQLKDYITVSADWISYALIDDITDAFAPLIQGIEDEVDDIDDQILRLHMGPSHSAAQPKSSDHFNADGESEKSDGNMLKRVGDCRKKVMGLYRLLGNKADVIKGFAKRCNEQWEVAPRSEIGLYLGDIQDHIVTMVANLNHYEKILSRSHSNYLAQINIKMNERQEHTADVLGKLTVLGTIVLPMNIITGLWGMNVLVPGQDVDNLNWFMGITAFLLLFGFLCYILAKRVYKIV